jgi:hypothetical protein
MLFTIQLTGDICPQPYIFAKNVPYFDTEVLLAGCILGNMPLFSTFASFARQLPLSP